MVKAFVGADDLEVRKEVTVNALNVESAAETTYQLMAHFSDWRKLKVTVAWFLRLKRTLLERSRKRTKLEASNTSKQGPDKGVTPQEKQALKVDTGGCALSADDLLEAELAIIQYCQHQRFGEEIAALSSGKGTVSKSSSICRLDPYLDNGLLRVGEQLAKGSLPVENKNPLILAKDQQIATLIITHIHQQLAHSHCNHMLSKLREKY